MQRRHCVLVIVLVLKKFKNRSERPIFHSNRMGDVAEGIRLWHTRTGMPKTTTNVSTVEHCDALPPNSVCAYVATTLGLGQKWQRKEAFWEGRKDPKGTDIRGNYVSVCEQYESPLSALSSETKAPCHVSKLAQAVTP
jgi:hypothetical protein